MTKTISKATVEFVEVCEWEYTAKVLRKALTLIEMDSRLAALVGEITSFVDGDEGRMEELLDYMWGE